MKKIALLVTLLFLSLFVAGCSFSSNPRVANFRDHFSSFSESPEDYIFVDLKHNRTVDLEDAFTKLCGYTSKDWYVSSSDAEDAWIYLSCYIDELHEEIADLYEEYTEVY